MKQMLKNKIKLIFLCSFLIISLNSVAQTKILGGNVKLVIKLKGVIQANVTAVGYQKLGFTEALASATQEGDSLLVLIPRDKVPAEIKLEFLFVENLEAEEKTANANIFVGNDNIELFLNPLELDRKAPLFITDVENICFENFAKQYSALNKTIQLSYAVCSEYDKKSKFYKQSVKEYNYQVENLNNWIDGYTDKNEHLFISHFFKLQKVIPMKWNLNVVDRLGDISTKTLNNVDFSDSLLVRSTITQIWLDEWFKLPVYRGRNDKEKTDSLLVAAGKLLCEKASKGHPNVYGWVVDYLFFNYESNSNNDGIAILKTYANDPNCLSTRKSEINRRLESLKRIKIGGEAPISQVENEEAIIENLSMDNNQFHLLVFYDSTCDHCEHVLYQLKKWQELYSEKDLFTVHSISLDNSFVDWKSYSEKHDFNWEDKHAPGGINGKIAKDFGLLATPSLVLLGENRQIELIPKSLDELLIFLYGEEGALEYRHLTN